MEQIDFLNSQDLDILCQMVGVEHHSTSLRLPELSDGDVNSVLRNIESPIPNFSEVMF